MEFRIGINLGDVVQEEERIYGDGINIAARVEGLAEGGGICISGAVFDSIKNKLSLSYESLGEHTVKNIKEPVRVYRMRIGPEAAVKTGLRRWHKAALAAVAVLVIVAGAWAIWNFYFRLPPIEPASVEKMAYPLPDKPSIAVLPFENVSGDPEQDYFSDGITIAIITRLYKIPADMLVIDRTSSSTYKGKSVKVHQVSEELGVRYVLEGSVQKSGDRIRITAQLIDATTGNHLWAESYDREVKDLFDVQDEITRKVVTELGVKLTWGEMVRSMTQATDNYEALDYYMQADKLFSRMEKEANARARELLMKAIELDPKFGRAIAFLGWTHLLDLAYRWVKNPAHSFKQAEELAKRALAIDDTVYLAHTLLSRIYNFKRQYEKAVAAGERAVDLEPNNAMGIGIFAKTMIYAGRPEEALVLIRKAKRLSPYPPPYFLETAGHANYLTGRYEAAITEYQKLLERQRHSVIARLSWAWLIASYMELGREEEARAEAEKLLEHHPDFSTKAYIKATKRIPFKDFAFLDRQIELLRKAGLK
jgi:adenylate cyclase